MGPKDPHEALCYCFEECFETILAVISRFQLEKSLKLAKTILGTIRVVS